jgi:riboflavin kinase/FMN adenylyltransferase
VRGPLFLAVGFFDGVHRGHLKVIAEAVSRAGCSGGRAWVLTFRPHPERLLRPQSAPPLLTSHEHKLRLLAPHGPAGVLVLPFTRELAALEPPAFTDLLLDGIPGLAEILVGRNWRFGRGGRGSTRMLARLGPARGLRVRVVNPVTRRGKAVSSTRIRREILRGNLDEAELMLGRPYSVLGTVVRGRSVGRRLGYPTANLDVHNEVLPPEGVYAARAAAGGKRHAGVLSIGSRPTFRDAPAHPAAVEVHLLDFGGRLYGEDVEVFIAGKIRSQVAFRSPAELKKRIEQDTHAARQMLAREVRQK